MKKENLPKILTVLSLFAVLIFTGCGSAATNKSADNSVTPKVEEKTVDTCMTLADFDNLLPVEWPNGYSEDAVRTCDDEDENGCCSSVGISLANDQANYVGLWIWSPDKSGDSAWIWLEDYAKNSAENGDILVKGDYKGYPAYEYSDIEGLFFAVEPYVIQTVWVGSSQEEVEAILSALKVY